MIRWVSVSMFLVFYKCSFPNKVRQETWPRCPDVCTAGGGARCGAVTMSPHTRTVTFMRCFSTCVSHACLFYCKLTLAPTVLRANCTLIAIGPHSLTLRATAVSETLLTNLFDVMKCLVCLCNSLSVALLIDSLIFLNVISSWILVSWLN